MIARHTASLKDATPPPTREIRANGEMYASRGILHQSPGQLPDSSRRNLQNGGDAKAADYVRSRWKFDLMRRTIDDAFQNVDLFVLPTRRREPRTVDTAKEREDPQSGAGKCGTIQRLWDPRDLRTAFTAAGLPVGLIIAGPHFSESRLVALARAPEAATDWHSQWPNLTPETVVLALKKTDL